MANTGHGLRRTDCLLRCTFHIDLCNAVTFAGQRVYEALVHEWMHNLDWALYYINPVPDLYQHVWPDWEHWDPGSWPACDTGASDTFAWFPSVDLCEWDPDWIDCDNEASASACLHAGEVGGNVSWYEHVIAAHYPRTVSHIGNHCRDGRQDFGETASIGVGLAREVDGEDPSLVPDTQQIPIRGSALGIILWPSCGIMGRDQGSFNAT